MPCARRLASTTSTKSLDGGNILYIWDEHFAQKYVDRHGDVPELVADPTLARKELGFNAPQDLVTMCRDLWNWQTKNPKGYGGPDEVVPAGATPTLHQL